MFNINMGDYFKHWLDIGKKLSNPPKIFNVNWFRTDEDCTFIWPGFGDYFRIIEWLLLSCENTVDAIDTPIGLLPFIEDINIDELDISTSTLEELLSIDMNLWLEETESIMNFYNNFGDKLPIELGYELLILQNKLLKQRVYA